MGNRSNIRFRFLDIFLYLSAFNALLCFLFVIWLRPSTTNHNQAANCARGAVTHHYSIPFCTVTFSLIKFNSCCPYILLVYLYLQNLNDVRLMQFNTIRQRKYHANKVSSNYLKHSKFRSNYRFRLKINNSDNSIVNNIDSPYVCILWQ